MESIGIKDNEEGVSIRLYEDDNTFITIGAPTGENGSFFTVWLRLTKVQKIEIDCVSSCAVPFINYLKEQIECPTEAPTSAPPTPSPTPEPTCDIDLDQRIRIQPKPDDGTCICCDDEKFDKLGDTGKLRFEYNVGSVLQSRQKSDKVQVTGNSNPICGDGERIVVSSKEGPNNAKQDEILFDGVVKCGDTFEASGEFKKATYIHVFFDGGVQTTEFHTSCSQAINIGDIYASVKVVGFTDKNGNSADDTPLDLSPGLNDATSISGDVKPGDIIVYTYIVDILQGPVTDIEVNAFDTFNGGYKPRLASEVDDQLVYVYHFTVPTVSSYPFSVEAASTVTADICLSIHLDCLQVAACLCQ